MGVNVITLDDIRTNKNPYISSADGYLEDDLEYHTSWDWLMPVVEKIENDERYDVDILQYGTRIREGQKDIVNNIADISFDKKIEHTYQAVVKFINRYNAERRKDVAQYDNNKLIAEFMEFPTHTDVVDDRTIAYYVGESIIWTDNTENENDYDVFHPEDMQFHLSWDWLIPVIHKCFDVAEDGDMDDIMHHLQVADRKPTYRAVIEFINQYNKTK